MSFWNAPLWKQLVTVWATALVLEVVLFSLQARRPFEVFWLLPYPNWRMLWPSLVALTRAHPLFALSVVVVPVVTLVLTVVLCVQRLRPILVRSGLAR